MELIGEFTGSFAVAGRVRCNLDVLGQIGLCFGSEQTLRETAYSCAVVVIGDEFVEFVPMMTAINTTLVELYVCLMLLDQPGIFMNPAA